MKPNNMQTAIATLFGVVLLALVLLPPWQEAAGREAAYRKEIGRGFVWAPPKAVAVECYFPGCVTAPPGYFHVLLNWHLLLQQCLTLSVVAVLFLWMFRTQPNREVGIVRKRGTRLSISVLLALLIPPTGGVPFGAALAGIPMMLVRRDELWLLPVIMTLVLYTACVLVIYGLITSALWFRRGGAT